MTKGLRISEGTYNLLHPLNSQEFKYKYLKTYSNLEHLENSVNGQVSASVKGNTVNQSVKNGNFANGTTDWINTYGTLSADNNIATVTITELNSPRLEQTNFPTIVGHKYFIVANMFAKYVNSTKLIIGESYSNGVEVSSMIIPNSWSRLYGVITATTTAPLRIYHATNANYVVGETYKFKDIIVIDLTAHGLEGKTIEELNQMFPSYLQYGTKSTLPATVRVTGKNLWNGDYVNGYISSDGSFAEGGAYRTTKPIKCKPNTQYTVNGGDRSNWRYLDSNGNYIPNSYSTGIATTTSPNNAVELQVYYSFNGTHTEIMINEGSAVLPYEPYRSTEAVVPVTLRSVPNGTKDELRATQN